MLTTNPLAPGNPASFIGANRVIGVGTANTDLLLLSAVDQKTCDVINGPLGIGSTADDFISSPFTGDFTPSATPDIGDENTSLQEQTHFCATNGGGITFFISVLLAR